MDSATISVLEKELEAKKQAVHVLRNKIAVADSLEADYLSEIESIGLSNIERKAKLKKEIKLEKQALVELDNRLATLHKLETGIIKDLMCQKIELERQITEADKRKQKQREAALNSHCDDEKVPKLMRKLAATQEEINTLSNESTSLQSKDKELDDLIAENKEILSSTAKDVFQKRHEFSLLQDKYSSLKMATESVDSEPPKLPAQGNSLFAEVHDSEMKLRAALSQLEKYHMKLELKHSSLVKELGDLRANLVNLCTGLDGIYELDLDNENIKQFKSELEKVKAEGEKYKNQIREKFQLFGGSNPDSTDQYVNAVIMEGWFEITSDITSIIELRLDGLNESLKLTKAQQEARIMQRTLATDEVKLQALKENYRKRTSCDN